MQIRNVIMYFIHKSMFNAMNESAKSTYPLRESQQRLKFSIKDHSSLLSINYLHLLLTVVTNAIF